MSVYQRKIKYQGRYNTDFGLQVVSFDPDDGLMDTYLTVESVFTDKFDGTMRNDYGAKYKETAILNITMVKNNYADFSRVELREILGWLTGLRKVSWLDLYNDDSGELSYSFLGRVSDVKLQKMDARVIGIQVEFTSVSPWAYSGIQRTELTLDGNGTLIPLCNFSDEEAAYIYPNITFVNKGSGTLNIINITTGEKTEIKGLAANEKVTLDTNKIIYSDNDTKIFNDDFNWIWVKLIHGYNHLYVTGTGHLIIEYRNVFKVADAFDDNDEMNTDPSYKNILHLKEINLLASDWTPDGSGRYFQDVKLDCATEYSKIDLQPTAEQILSLQSDGAELQVINNKGNIKAYSYGGKPSINLIMQATIEETNKTINRRYEDIVLYADAWKGSDNVYTQPVFIKYLKKSELVAVVPTAEQSELLDDADTTIFIKNDNGNTVAYAVGYKPDINYNFEVAITNTTTDVYRSYLLPDEDIYVEPLYY